MSQSVLNFLRTLPLFGDVDIDGLDDLYETMGLTRYEAPGQIVFDVGDKPDGAYIVLKGLCALSAPGSSEPKEICRLGRGAVVGELCLISAARRTLRLSVIEAADILVINGPAFHALRETGHAGAYQLLRNVGQSTCERLRDTNELLELEWRGETRAPTTILAPEAAKSSAWQRLIRLASGRKATP